MAMRPPDDSGWLSATTEKDLRERYQRARRQLRSPLTDSGGQKSRHHPPRKAPERSGNTPVPGERDPFACWVEAAYAAHRPVTRTRTERLTDAVLWHYGISRDELMKPEPIKWSVSRMRFVLFWCLRQQTNLSYSQIGHRFGRDHTSVLHGIRRVEKLLAARDEATVTAVESILRRADLWEGL